MFIVLQILDRVQVMRTYQSALPLLTFLLILCALTVPPTSAGAAGNTQTAAPPISSAQNTVQHELFGGFWRIDHSFQARLRLKSSLVADSITVTPVLYMADGTEFVLSETKLSPNGSATIDINNALRHAPSQISGHSSVFGSASLRFQHAWNPIAGVIDSTDAPRSLVFTYPLQEFSNTDFQAQDVEGLWWKHDAGVHSFTVLTNSSANPVTAMYRVTGARGTGTTPEPLTIAPHASVWLELETLIKELPNDEQQVGGLSFRYTAAQGALTVSGGMENAMIDYSATMHFSFDETKSPDFRRLEAEARAGRWSVGAKPGAGTETNVASVGLMAGKPNALEGFPEGLRFIPYAVMRNVSSKPIKVKGALNLMTGSTIDLGIWQFAPGEARQLDLQSALSGAGLGNFDGMLTLSFRHSGAAGELLVASGSVSQNGSYTFEVAASAVGPSGGRDVPFWSVGDGYDTMLTLWNSGTVAEDLVVSLHYGNRNGSYKLPVRLAPNASSTISLLEVMNLQQPDDDGRVLPLDVREGSATIASAKGEGQTINATVSAGVFNAQNGTCAVITCYGCNGFVSWYSVVDPFSLAASGSQQSRDFVTWHDGTNYDRTSGSSWSSTDTTIATVQTAGQANPGMMYGVSPGASPLYVVDTNEPYYVSSICNASCPYANPGGNVHGSIVAVPTNFRQQGAAVSDSDGNLHFNYLWDSSTGKLSDLSSCIVGENVTYPGTGDYYWSSPPYGPAFVHANNPTAISFNATDGAFGDVHSHPDFLTPYRADGFTATQTYRWSCSNFLAGSWQSFQQNTIDRAVTQHSFNSTWYYSITKSGSGAVVDPLP